MWFQEGSTIGVDDSATPDLREDPPRVAFYEYKKEESEEGSGSVPPVFGKSLPQKQAKNLIETSLRSARMYG